jgi:tetratricopeptide (TPR) repeat protein
MFLSRPARYMALSVLLAYPMTLGAQTSRASTALADPTLDRAYVALRGGDTTAALEILTALEGARVADLRVFLSEAGVQRARHQWPQATATLTRGLQRLPGETTLRLEIALTRAFAGQYGSAVALYDSLLRRTPSLLPAQSGRAWALAWSGQTTAAMSAFAALYAGHPTDLGVISGLAFLSRRAGHATAAMTYYRAMLAIDSTNTEARDALHLPPVHVVVTPPARPIAPVSAPTTSPIAPPSAPHAAHDAPLVASSAGASSPLPVDSVAVLLARALAARRAGNGQAADVSFAHAAHLAPNNIPVQLEWAGLDVEQHRWSRAEERYHGVLRLDPLNAPAANGLARIAGWEGRTEEAQLAYEAVLRKHPADVEARNGLAALDRQALHLRAARAEYHAVLARDTTNAEARAGLTAMAFESNAQVTLMTGSTSQRQPDPRTGSNYAADLSYRWNAGGTVFAGYAWNALGDARTGVGSIAGAPGTQSTLMYGGVAVRPWSRLSTGASYYYRRNSLKATAQALWLEAAVQVGGPFTVLTGLRPQTNSRQRGYTGTGVFGLTTALPVGPSVTVELLDAPPGFGDPAYTWIGRVDGEYGRRWRYQGSVTTAKDDYLGFTVTGVSAMYMATPLLGVRAEASTRTTTFSRTDLGAGLVIHF